MRGERGCLDRRGWRLANHIPCFSFLAKAGRETHPTATGWSEQHKSGPLCGLVALPKHQDVQEKARKTSKINDLRLFDSSAFGPGRAELQRSRTAKTKSALSQRTCAIALHIFTIPHMNGNAINNFNKIECVIHGR
jgi:hypothetical protein